MKKILLFLVAVMIGGMATMTAQGVSNKLVVESKNGEPFVLRVDGFAKNKKPQTKVVADKLYSNVVRISIEFADSAYAAVHNYEVVLTRKSAKDADSMMKGYVAYYTVKAGKRSSKMSKVSIKPITTCPVERYVPEIPKEAKKGKKSK